MKRAVDALDVPATIERICTARAGRLVLPLVHAFTSPRRQRSFSYTAKATRRGRPAGGQEHLYVLPCHSTSRHLGPLHIEAAVHGSAGHPRHSVSWTRQSQSFSALRCPICMPDCRRLGLRQASLYCPQDAATQDSEGCIPRLLARAVKLVDIKV